jgi:hypothetical protein
VAFRQPALEHPPAKWIKVGGKSGCENKKKECQISFCQIGLRSGASDLIERDRPFLFLVISRIFFDQPVSDGSENALRVCAVLPILAAIEVIAAHRDGCSCS